MSAPWGGAPAARGKVRSRRGPGPDLQVVVHAGDEESPGSAGQLRFELVVHPLLQHRPGERGVDADPAPCRDGLVGADDAVARGFAAVGVLHFHVGAEDHRARSEEHTSELQSLMRISYAVFCLTNKKPSNHTHDIYQ